jgi:digeranylgeranylglycerophospholipid reductase
LGIEAGHDTSLPAAVDALIVGAGPGGQLCAWELAAAGATVLLVDARARIGHPLRCGELTRNKFFEDIEIEPQPGWVRWQHNERNFAKAIDREKMESELAGMLADKGVLVRPGVSVVGVGEFDGQGRKATMEAAGQRVSVKARCIIAADGVASRVAKYCGVETYVPPAQMAACLAYRLVDAEVQNPNTYELRYLPDMSPFYFWAIPTGEHEANVGLSLPARLGFTLRRRLAAGRHKYQGVTGGRIAQTIVGMYSVCPPLEKPYADGLLIVGGAARLVFPLVGEGIYQAAMSGKAAGRLLATLDARDLTADSLAPYRAVIQGLYDEITGGVVGH